MVDFVGYFKLVLGNSVEFLHCSHFPTIVYTLAKVLYLRICCRFQIITAPSELGVIGKHLINAVNANHLFSLLPIWILPDDLYYLFRVSRKDLTLEMLLIPE